MIAELEYAPSFAMPANDESIIEIEYIAVNRPHCLCGGATPLHLGGCPVMVSVYAELVSTNA